MSAIFSPVLTYNHVIAYGFKIGLILLDTYPRRCHVVLVGTSNFFVKTNRAIEMEGADGQRWKLTTNSNSHYM
jgi:hypothetical protein